MAWNWQQNPYPHLTKYRKRIRHKGMSLSEVRRKRQALLENLDESQITVIKPVAVAPSKRPMYLSARTKRRNMSKGKYS